MNGSEIGRNDAKRNDKPKDQVIFGRGSKIKRRWAGDQNVYTLLHYRDSFWTAVNPDGLLTNVSENQIESVLIGGHWRAFSGNPREWKRVY